MAAAILFAANDHLSSQHTAGFLERIFGSSLAVDVANFLLRKAAHVTEYAVLSALAFRAIRGERGGWKLAWAIGAIVYVVVVASGDEYRQSHTRQRDGTPRDVIIDTCGAALAQFLIRRRALHLPA